MATITKKELIDRIADATDQKRVMIKRVVQMFLDQIVEELGRGNRLEFRDFGVFETKTRKARRAQNPRTLEPVRVPEKRTVKFKVGRLMKAKLDEADEAREAARATPDRPGGGGGGGNTHDGAVTGQPAAAHVQGSAESAGAGEAVV